MRITDYEAGKNLSDVCISLTQDEAQELAAYLHRLIKSPDVNRAYLSEIVDSRLEKEITISLVGCEEKSEGLKAIA
ncbi:MAG TPA: hypothetical protein VEX38_05485 [Fimbriimonadaceae bacterium]|nr:hypothetical protein [Fimbriimonadaceae bacterium]